MFFCWFYFLYSYYGKPGKRERLAEPANEKLTYQQVPGEMCFLCYQMKQRWIKIVALFLCAGTFHSCQDPTPDPELPIDPEVPEDPIVPVPEAEYFIGTDLSSLPEIEAAGTIFYNTEGQLVDAVSLLKSMGMNTIRLRLWVDPQDEHSGLAEVKAFAERLRSARLKLWLSVHYSDTWADPGKQVIPAAWQGLSFPSLKDSVASYTQRVAQTLQPDIIQLGNEINSGLLHPQGDRNAQPEQFLELLIRATQAVRETTPEARIMLHYAGIAGADAFFDEVAEVDYDQIGLSYYPRWHGKDLADLKTTLRRLSERHEKEVLIAETAYPFTLDWADWTNNLVGLEEQVILPSYPASPQGQQDFISVIQSITTREVALGRGFCYWGAELVAWRGPEATDGSPWENQALFDFEHRALPVLDAIELPQ
ncbi:MAG TPA: arabinogalactan endo-1,4-beta-galactosidase [Cytophagales bacterium]|nr:arabinogalactan endo-1,4-beta-galactosidase [Cytophagales bacterium]